MKTAIRSMIPARAWSLIASIRDARRLEAAERAVAKFPTVREQRAHALPGPLVVSVTSYPKRFPTLAKTLRSLLDQTVRADRTVLWLANDDTAPADVRALTTHGFEIRFTTDLRSYKKIIPALSEWPEAYICIADDDTYYEPNWLQSLVSGVAPGVISCRRAHRPRRYNGRLAPYSNWEWSIIGDGRIEDLFPTGCGGVLYPPNSLDRQVLDEATFQRLCPHADDVWLYMMARKAGSFYRQVGGGSTTRYGRIRSKKACSATM